MLQQAAAGQAIPPEKFQCDQCDFTSSSKHGVSSHKGYNHKTSQKPDTLRELEQNKSLNLSNLSVERDEYSSFNADEEEPGEEELRG